MGDYHYKNNLDLDRLLGIGWCFSQRYNSNARTNSGTFHASGVQFSIAKLAEADNVFSFI